MANPAQNLTSLERSLENAERPALERAHTPTSSGDRSGAVPDRYHLRYWHTDIGRRHNELPCLGGACDGAEDGGKCERHQRTGEVIERLIRLRLRQRARLNRERAIKVRLEAHHRRLPCHPDDYGCDADGHVCFRHSETEQYVRRAFARFQRMREARRGL